MSIGYEAGDAVATITLDDGKVNAMAQPFFDEMPISVRFWLIMFARWPGGVNFSVMRLTSVYRASSAWG